MTKLGLMVLYTVNWAWVKKYVGIRVMMGDMRTGVGRVGNECLPATGLLALGLDKGEAIIVNDRFLDLPFACD